MITSDAEKAQEKWPPHAAKTGVTGPSHQTAVVLLSNCSWVELHSENVLRTEISRKSFTARKIHIVLPFCVVEVPEMIVAVTRSCWAMLPNGVRCFWGEPAMSTAEAAANTLPPAAGKKVIQKLPCQVHLCHPSRQLLKNFCG